MPDAHSKFSASNFEADTLCPGRRVMGLGLPDNGSKYADEGTAAHALLEDLLNARVHPAGYVVNGNTWPITDDMATAVQTALDNIHRMTAGGMLLSEQQVNYSSYLGVPKQDAWGTADVIALVGDELQVHDYKHGRGVLVEADDNPQMKLYALGALEVLRAIGEEPTSVRLVIHQPRIRPEPSEFTLSVKALEMWGFEEAAEAAALQNEALAQSEAMQLAQWEREFLKPNEKSCRFCRAKASCPALRDTALGTMTLYKPATPDEFTEIEPITGGPGLDGTARAPTVDWLAAVMNKADLIEDWLASVRAEVERRLLAGQVIPGWKIVQGKRGNRAWSDPAAAEAELKTMRLKVEEMYDLKLISPTTAEKLAAAKTIGPRQWKKLQAQISQADGKPHVAPVTDKRPALLLTPPADDFEVVSTTPALESEFA